MDIENLPHKMFRLSSKILHNVVSHFNVIRYEK